MSHGWFELEARLAQVAETLKMAYMNMKMMMPSPSKENYGRYFSFNVVATRLLESWRRRERPTAGGLCTNVKMASDLREEEL